MPDLEEAEEQAASHVGFENHPYGRILIRLIRLMRLATTRLKALEDRVKALEDATP